jgi:hypothetical protein
VKRLVCVVRLLFAVTYSLFAQNWTAQDSLKLHQLLNSKEELKLNLDALKELRNQSLWGIQEVSVNKSWLNYDETLPEVPHSQNKVVLTLHPYTANTRYNWDPVYQKKITVKKDTWRGDLFYALTKMSIYSNWAKHPFDKGARRSIEEIEATGLSYGSHLEGNIVATGWSGVSSPSGHDFMTAFSKEFWSPKMRKRRARTLEVLRAYGDSTTVLINKPIHALDN